MPWKETCVEDEKVRFVTDYLTGEEPMVALCARYGVSRDTGYRLVGRYRESGIEGLAPRPRAPHSHGRAMPTAVAEAIIALRRARPYWGPKKLRVILARESPGICWPAPSTMGDLLRREGLSAPKRRKRTAVPLGRPFLPVLAPNDLWCIDFKGWFRTGDGRRCDPLTLTDAFSRLLITCQIVPPTGTAVQPEIDRAMRELGLPRAIRSDNGPPFASIGAGGLTPLAVHWLKLGIRLERIVPGKPEQNGRHERMHATLKAETAAPPAANRDLQQARFDRFRHEFNHDRPHEALGQATPASLYRASHRPYPKRIEEPVYPEGQAIRRVRTRGEIKWKGDMVFISTALCGEPVAIAETDTGDWRVRFADVELGTIDRATKQLRRDLTGRSSRQVTKPKQTEKTVRHPSGP